MNSDYEYSGSGSGDGEETEEEATQGENDDSFVNRDGSVDDPQGKQCFLQLTTNRFINQFM